MKKIRIAQLGTNRYSHGAEVFDTLKSLPDIFEIVGYAVVEDERENCKKALAAFEGYNELSLDEILNDPSIEVVTVETDEIHLCKYALMAAKHGKHIHMEKPGSQSYEDFKEIVDVMKANGKVFHLGYMYRYNPYVADAIQRVRDGKLGKIYSVEAHMSRYDNKETREWFNSFKGGMMFYLGCHLVDLVLQIQGEPKEIIPMNTVTGLDGVQSEDLGFAVMKYENGISMIRMGGCEIGGYNRRQLVICGSEGSIEIKPLEAKYEGKLLYTERTDAFIGEDGHTKRVHSKSEPFHRYLSMMTAFSKMVRGEIQNPYTYDYELTLFKAVLKCCGIDV